MKCEVGSADGTRIACTTIGESPHLVIVLGALNTGRSGAKLAKLLSAAFTVTSYDRRGRGGSGDAADYSPLREIEDLQAVIDDLGGRADLYGHSSGAAIVLGVAGVGDGRARRIAIYEAPYLTSADDIDRARRYDRDLRAALAADDRDAAVARFLAHVGVSDKQVAAMRSLPMWKGLAAMAPTLAYDSAVLGAGQEVPRDAAARVACPALVMYGGRGAASMPPSAEALSSAIPQSELRAIEGQDHGVSPGVIAPVLSGYFSR